MRVGKRLLRWLGVGVTSAMLSSCSGTDEATDDTTAASGPSAAIPPVDGSASAGTTTSASTRPTPSPLPSCGVSGGTTLTGSGIGALRIGVSAAQIRSRCMVLSEDTAAPGPEGQKEHRLIVVTGSVNTTATLVNNRVWRLQVASPVFRTADSLGVGTQVSELRGPNARLARGEGTYVLRRDHCGLSFQLGRGVPATAQTLEAVPDSVRVSRVLVIGC
jgi:hypothetical protein